MQGKITHVTLQVLDVPVVDYPNAVMVTLRCHPEEREIINQAAATLGMTQAAFVRMVCIKAARGVQDQIVKPVNRRD